MLTPRPRIGTVGEAVMVEVNCWDFEVADVQIHRYDIQPMQPQEVTENGINQLKLHEKFLLKYMKFVYNLMDDDVFSDANRFCFSLEPLERKFTLSEPQYLDVYEGERKLRLKYVIKKLRTISAQSIKQYMENPNSMREETPQKAINMLDNLFRWVNRKIFEIFLNGVYLRDPEKICSNGLYSIYRDTGKSFSKVLTMFSLSDKTADEIIIKAFDMSVTEYFTRKYGIVLKYPNLPCVRIEKNRDEFMPMELLTVLPFQKAREDKRRIASEVTRIAAVKPSERFRDLERMVKQVMSLRSSLISKLNLKFTDPKPVRVVARELPQPNSRFFNGTQEMKRGSWSHEPFLESASTFLKWVIVVLHPFKIRNVDWLRKELPMAAQKSGLEMDRNSELGGSNWQVSQLSDWWGKEIIMVAGADVTHPTSKNGGLRKSVAAVVASISPDLVKYAAVVRQQEHKLASECINGMKDIFTDLLDGQFYQVLESELGDIQEACTDIRPGYEPGITFIVVQKHHHIRSTPISEKSQNISPGTVVDSEITHNREFDFYLCSHKAIQGTSKPAHYTVLYDDNDWDSDDLQLFTYFLCRASMRSNRTISYPTPTYYAHLAAFRGRSWLKDALNPSAFLKNSKFAIVEGQKDLMFFLKSLYLD
ncbi:unnamed protein product [Rodentolepis nana]|uniref:Piwi domain-containing protein n=1 Tax=Rodentolepis nana TaxID=102285 RepID=A0A0R3T3Z8_RODNA|nr:unnamed protein product [Rodentolepis nana]